MGKLLTTRADMVFPNCNVAISRKIWTSTISGAKQFARAKFVFCDMYIKNRETAMGYFLSELILNRLDIGRLFNISTLI